MEKRRLHPFEALTKTLKWRMELKNGGAPLVADEIGCGADDRGQVEDCASVTVSSFVLMSLNSTPLIWKSSQQCPC